MSIKFISQSARQTRKIGKEIALKILQRKIKKRILALIGDLGGGKTTFLKGFARGLGIKTRILSPTFILFRKFTIPQNPSFKYFYHIDCYRIEKPKEILDLGFQEIVKDSKNIVAIEWADKIFRIIPQGTLFISFQIVGPNKRAIKIKNDLFSFPIFFPCFLLTPPFLLSTCLFLFLLLIISFLFFTAKIKKLKSSFEEEKEKSIVWQIREKAKTLDIARKVQELEKAKNMIEAERNKTLAIIENLTEGLLVFDKKQNLLLLNPQTTSLLKIKKENIIGKNLSELKKIPFFRLLSELMKENSQTVCKKEIEINKNTFISLSSAPIFLKGENIGTLVLLRDVTREKAIERMKTEFVSISAHQLRTPLSAIKWILKTILDGDLGPLSKMQKEYLEKAYASNERMISLIHDLLNVTRIEEGRFLYKLEPVNLVEIVESIVRAFKKEIDEKKLKVTFIKSAHFPLMKLDKEKISIAIQNLIENAIRYTPEKGKILISLKKKDNQIEFFVKDTGIGIPKDQQERIFSKFFRAKNAIKIEPNGSGLGLFVTKKVIEAHGGKIWFQSEEGKGSTFYFTLPAKVLK